MYLDLYLSQSTSRREESYKAGHEDRQELTVTRVSSCVCCYCEL